MPARSLVPLVLCMLLLAPPVTHAEWSAPFDLSLPGSSRREPQVAVAPSGAAVGVWLARTGTGTIVQARRIDADGTLGPILDLSEPGRIPSAPDVAIDAAGNATVVWSDRESPSATDAIVRARRVTAAGALEPTVDLTGPGLSSVLPNVEVSPSGAVTVIWTRIPVGTVHLRRIDPVGGPGATLTLSAPTSGHADVAVDADGDAYVVWVTADGGDQVVNGVRVQAGGAPGSIDPLSDDGLLSFTPQVALDAAGTPTVAWLREDDSIELRRALGSTTVFAPPGTADALGDLAVDGAGGATVVWTGPSGASQAVFLRRVPATGPPEPVNDLWSGGNDDDPRLAVDGAGTPTLIWSNSDATGATTIRTRTAAAGAAFGPVAEVWPPTTGVFAGEPQIASSAAGQMTAVWRRVDSSEEAIVAARFTQPPPAPPAQSGPAEPLAAPPPSPLPGCGAVTLQKLGAGSDRPPKTRRAKGVAADLTVDRPARVDLMSATLSYRLGGRSRSAALRAKDVTADRRARLRFTLPSRLAGRLRLGHRVTLVLRLRARPADGACPYDSAATLKLRTRVSWVPRR